MENIELFIWKVLISVFLMLFGFAIIIGDHFSMYLGFDTLPKRFIVGFFFLGSGFIMYKVFTKIVEVKVEV